MNMPQERDGLEARLNALLALEIERHLRETGVTKARSRSVDKLLADAGLSTTEIGSIMGKTERAVQLVLQKEKKGGPHG